MTCSARELAERQEAERREVGERLVEVPDERREVVRVARASSTSSSWWSAPSASATRRASGSSESSPAKPTENVLTGSVHVPRHQRDDQARVEAAAEHRAERHVAHQAHAHRLVELRRARSPPTRSAERATVVGRRRRVVPPALEPGRAVLDDQALAGLQLADLLQRRHRRPARSRASGRRRSPRGRARRRRGRWRGRTSARSRRRRRRRRSRSRAA